MPCPTHSTFDPRHHCPACSAWLTSIATAIADGGNIPTDLTPEEEWYAREHAKRIQNVRRLSAARLAGRSVVAEARQMEAERRAARTA